MENDKEHAFEWLRFCAPQFKVDGDNIQVLYTPKSFHCKLKQEASKARKRIVLAALYLGTGELEKELIQAVIGVAKLTKNQVKVDILLDCVRGSRGLVNSKTMLKQLMEQYKDSGNLQIALYHTPKLRGMLKSCLPGRYNEIVGVAHLKAFIFDDTLIISGANLSNDYFENRQDRYVVCKDCPDLAAYFYDIVSTVSKFSFILDSDQNLKLNSDWKHHPYKGDYDSFTAEAHNIIQELIKPLNDECGGRKERNYVTNKGRNIGFFGRLYNMSIMTVRYLSTMIMTIFGIQTSKEHLAPVKETVLECDKPPISQTTESTQIENSEVKELGSKSRKLDTWIYPTVQMGLFGIRQDEVVTEMLMKFFPKGSINYFTSGYFNVTDEYCDLILKNEADYKIILAAPEANGFYGSSGMSRFIPAVYVQLCKVFQNKVQDYRRKDGISLFEYCRKGWTFHGKGMWSYMPGESLPSMTMIGSPNFGFRSVNRDLEAQLVIVTKNEKLRKQLHKEQTCFLKYSREINNDTFRQQRYRVPRWVALITFIIKRYF